MLARWVTPEYTMGFSPGCAQVNSLVSGNPSQVLDFSCYPDANAFVPPVTTENYAHDQVCRGEITLQEAQRRIATNWLQYWTEAGKP